MKPDKEYIRPLIVNIFAFCTVPLACWQKWIFPFISNYHLQHTFVYWAGLFMLWAWCVGFWSSADAWRLLKKAAPWLVALFLLQTAACWQSAVEYPVAGQATGITVVISLAKLAAQVPFLFFFAFLCMVLTRSKTSRRCLLAGAVAAFGIITAICLVQAFVMYARETPITWLGELAVKAKVLNNALAPFLEAQWKDAVYDFYSEGSYTAQLLKMNGVFEEASVLAVWVGCFFLPIALGMTVAHSRWQYCGWVMFALCLAILFGATAFTGVILGIVGMAVASVRIIMQWKNIAVFLYCFLALAFVVGVAFYIPAVQTKLQPLRGVSSPRAVVSMATLEVVKKHPVIGVGRGHLAAHVTQEDVYNKAIHDMELRTWKEHGTVPKLTTLPAAMAEYGILLVLLTLSCFLFLFRKLHNRLRQYPSSRLYRFGVAVYGVWLIMNATAALGDLETRNALFLLPLFCFYAVSELEEGGNAL